MLLLMLFFFNDTATTEIYTLSLHDALPISINILSVFNPDVFNEVSHFMGTSSIIQFVIQPILIFGVVFHFVMGFILEFKNLSSRKVKYIKNQSAANSSWMSRNMIWSGDRKSVV